MIHRYKYFLFLIGFLFLMQACVSEPKLEFQSTQTRKIKVPSLENWKNGVMTTKDGHVITKGIDKYGYCYIKTYNKLGQKDGLFGRYKKENINTVMEKRYKNNILNGISRIYGIDTPYINGLKEGREKEFKTNSYMVRSTPYHLGKKHGVEQVFFYTTGGLKKRITYDRGTKKKIEHYCKKKISLRTRMDGCRHGMEKAWHCGTGILKRETPYHYCKRHGVEKVYDKQGNLIYAIPYQNGIKEGEVKGYYPNGKIKYKVTYHADKVDEVGYVYNTKGKRERIDYDTIMKFTDRLPISVEYWRL